MTVGIAAFADNSKKLIIASDQMITSTVGGSPLGGGITYQWQSTDIHKIFPLPRGTGAILMAGNESYARTIINTSIRSIETKKAEEIEAIVEIVREEYANFRLINFVQSVLVPRGIQNFSAYYELHARLANDLRTFIDTTLGNWSGCCDLIVAGKDRAGTFSLYSISNPGIANNHDLNGYVCIGTGGPHAMYHIIGAGYKKGMPEPEVKKILEEAKKKSEVAPGVGSFTDCRTIS